ncbi:ABC transporter ATP-binding protein [Rhizobium sp. NRK18]|uniref:ABC transporter ATP-binding protein n=1 Tax=Rhizobium sp. NRK18 TaxID=2964667 RepID=UPI0021C3078E|nr:sn-glycerol-3-phosphate ABC transporter ATP-binding protein UgpC [Rhizobium sp. NRK18]MCQ2006296.1 sn-glycerol-3-phosphate ABC transporter ATP-binding protein UgpC [Rhizobium sp. NRK18]
MTDVKISQLRKSYGIQAALHGLDIDMNSGEFVVLVGPSGCGKSTLLRMIAGLESITSGIISFGGKVVNNIPAKNRDIAMVFQNYALYPHMTVRDNMGFSLKLRNVGEKERNARVDVAAKSLGLSHLLDRYPRQLSGGQRQRVAMGRAVVREPALFLFDEPLSNLDAKLRVQMRTEIKQMHNRLKATMIYVTHDQVEAMTLGDRIVVMRDGRVEQIGKPIDLYDEPANEFVAGFLGSPSMNFINGTLGADRQNVVLADGSVLTLPAPVAGEAGQAVHLGLRPEQLLPSDTGLSFEIDVIEPTGGDTIVMLRNPAIVGEASICLLLHERYDLRSGQMLTIAPKPNTGHVFDAKDGRRLLPSVPVTMMQKAI